MNSIVKHTDENNKTSLDYSIAAKIDQYNTLLEVMGKLRKELRAFELVRDIRDGKLVVSAPDGGSVELSFS